jgi:hypothetical protein
MKIKRETAKAKEEFAQHLFESTPLKAAQINTKVLEQFGAPLRTNTLYGIQRLIRGERPKKVKNLPSVAAEVEASL